ncbi:hypothetical protein MBLNU230_g1952t1 [Neophaeotheca triangularis]
MKKFSRKKTNRQSESSSNNTIFASDASLQHPDRRSIGHLLGVGSHPSYHSTEQRPPSNGALPSPSISPSLLFNPPYSPESLVDSRSPEPLQQRDGVGGVGASALYDQAAYESQRQSSMSNSHHSGQAKTSSDSGQQPPPATDRWSQRRLQRLNTEQGFREQRQGGQQTALSPPLPVEQPQPVYQQGQHPYEGQQSHQPSYITTRPSPASHPNAGILSQTQQASNLNVSRSPNFQPQEQPHIQVQGSQSYSPADHNSQENHKPGLQQSRSFNLQERPDETPMSSSNNGGNPAGSKGMRSTGSSRQSVHNGLPREGSGLGGNGGQQQSYNASVVPPLSQGQGYRQQGDHGRVTPQAPLQGGLEEMSEEDVAQLVKDHKELREKYTKVKKYYFEKEDQVKQLQNSLAHQRLSQSRTSLDDSEYTARFNRLDGLIAQLAFSIRKNWRSMPPWLVQSVNKDAVQTGKQEMTAAGRAFISCWLVEEVFDKYFHPDLDPTTSTLLKTLQRNIRRFAPPAQSAEEEDYLIAKVVNWRLSTLEALTDALRSPACPSNRQTLTTTLQNNLIAALASHLQDPPPADLEGGVHMIIELVVSIAIHLPVESRDVAVEYFLPGTPIVPEQMKVESGIPPLGVSIADDGESLKSVASDVTAESGDGGVEQAKTGKRGMLSAFSSSSGKGAKTSQQQQQQQQQGQGLAGAGAGRPESAQGKEEPVGPPRARMAAGIGVQVRGRVVLVKAPVFSL